MAIKASVAVMLLRVAIERSQRLIIWITIIITELYSASFFFLFVFQCFPSQYFWTQFTGGKGKCMNTQITVNSTYAYSAIICAGDWVLAIMPFFIVWKLKMERRQKFLVALILAMGAIASTATIVRIPYLSSLSNMADFLYATTDVAIWSACETGLCIVAASGATLRPLFREMNILGTAQGKSQPHNTYGASNGQHGHPFELRRGPSARRAASALWNPSDIGVGYVTGGNKGNSTVIGVADINGRDEIVRSEPQPSRGQIRATTQIFVHDYMYGHHGRDRDVELGSTNTPDSPGSDDSESQINKDKQLPGIPCYSRREM
jgi:hypothetical protein